MVKTKASTFPNSVSFGNPRATVQPILFGFCLLDELEDTEEIDYQIIALSYEDFLRNYFLISLEDDF